MANSGALTQAPRHSTSDMVNIPSFVVSPTPIPNVFYNNKDKKD